ncbi:MAG: c-type cytochrome, partial [Caldilineaceae bacterium]|nr:c-type cytochrome [Caldilineaceae bacterium]
PYEGRSQPVTFRSAISKNVQSWWKMAIASLLAMLILVVGFSFALGQEQPPPSPPVNLQDVPLPQEAPLARMGEGLFQENCAPCHGVQGGGDGPATAQMPVVPTAFADPAAVWELSPAELFYVTKFGRLEKMMPPWLNRMNDDEIWQTVYYAWDLHTSEADVSAGQVLYAADCAACHGPEGRGDGPEAGGEMLDFADLGAMMILSQAALSQNWFAAHPEIGADLSEEDQRSVLSYIRTFSYAPTWASLLGTGVGTIQGTIEQQTPGGGNFPGGTVSLEVYAHMTPLDALETTVDDDGNFVFNNLPVDPGIFYLVVTQYRGVRYSTPVLRFGQPDAATADPNTLIASLPIYETGDDASGISISRMSWIVEHEPGALLIGQIVYFGNNSDRTFTGVERDGVDVPVTLALPLPAGVDNIGLQDGTIGGDYRQVGNVIYDTRPVPPGEGTRQIFVRYRMPYNGTSATVVQPVDYPMGGMELWIASLPNLRSEPSAAQGQLQFAGEQQIQGMPYRQWTANALPAQNFTLQLSGLIAAGEQDPRLLNPADGIAGAQGMAVTPALDPMIPLVMGGVVLLLLAGVVVWRWRSGSTQPDDAPLAPKQRREWLIQEVAHLDDQHALGELDDDSWQVQRAALKRELYALTMQSGEKTGD